MHHRQEITYAERPEDIDEEPVEEAHVVPGERVAEGQALVTLRNQELGTQRDMLISEISRTQI